MGDSNNDNTEDSKQQSPTLDTPTSQSAVNLDQGEHVATTPIHLPIQEPSSSKKPLIWTLVIIITLALIGGGVYYFMTMTKPADTTATASITPKPTPTPVAKDAKTLIEQIKPALKAKLATIDKTTATDGELTTGHVAYTAANYQTKGHEFANGPLATAGIASTGTKAEAAADYKTVTDFLTAKNFKQLSKSDDTPENTYSAWVSDAAVCSVSSIDLLTTTVKAVVTGVACADITSYETAAKAIEPFYNASRAQTNTLHDATVLIGNPDIQDGKDGYKAARVNFGVVNGAGGAAYLFYQEPGKDIWTYFMGTQDTIPCSDFTTMAVRKAFANADCTSDLKTGKTVKVSTLQ